MPPLFPENDQPVFIEQGSIGDCYLLTVFDCLYNSTEGRKRLKNMFTELKNGDVEVRIKRSDQSSFLKPNKINQKNYHYEYRDNQDIITIPKASLETFVKDTRGAKTNSLAVLILEHLSSYYFLDSNADSLQAHNSQWRYAGTAPDFMAKIVGFEAGSLKNIEQVIKLKKAIPDEPVYISMAYGKPDRQGIIHGYHALRIHSITPNLQVPGGYEFTLINPWNNMKMEIWSLEAIKKRNPQFACFYKNKEKKKFTLKLLSLPENEVKFILKHAALKDNLFSLYRATKDLDNQFIRNAVSLYKRFPSIFDKIPLTSGGLSIFHSPTQKDALLACLRNRSDQFENNYQLLVEKCSTDTGFNSQFESNYKLFIKKCFPNTVFNSQEEVKKLTDYIDQVALENPEENPEEKIMDFYFLQDFELLPQGKLRTSFIHPETISALPRLQTKLLARGIQLFSIHGLEKFGVDGRSFLKSDHLADQPLYRALVGQEKGSLGVLKNIFCLREINLSLSNQLLKLAQEDLAKTSFKSLKKLLEEQPSDSFKDWLKLIVDSHIETHKKWNNELALEIRKILKEQQPRSLAIFFEKITAEDFISKFIKDYEKHFGVNPPQKEIDDIVLTEWKRMTNCERPQWIKQLRDPTQNISQLGSLSLLFKQTPKQLDNSNLKKDTSVHLSQQP
ncbi:hypothetical protein BN59_01515 [Legionella massiliensis]|uniref:Calpain family cysteine protease n=1 Tax=Legionella massiliensis TaxID=1034943 RepID=A0A078KZN0_9GAMM|nr:hypothetical protein [Legionella massiliensis]CDZ77233.1 hypothetical protein BN59_01515 [Legionella massiliensis]CEE12971.1 hypothetical protein BN1094_01515 [Legionella massiliensis]